MEKLVWRIARLTKPGLGAGLFHSLKGLEYQGRFRAIALNILSKI
ncbi:hypothetical protein [Anabaena sp. CCY 0017]